MLYCNMLLVLLKIVHDFVKVCEFVFENVSEDYSLQNSHGFKTDGTQHDHEYVDLGNWTGDTCFVDVNTCEQGMISTIGNCQWNEKARKPENSAMSLGDFLQ